jgi:hypothetical protein
MLIVIRKMAYVSVSLPGMTMMTLMTVIYGLILDNLPDNPTPLPDDGPPLSSGYREHRRILYTEPDDNKRLTYAGYSGYRRVRRVLWRHGSHQQEVEECTLHRECFVTTFCAVITPSLRVKSRNGECIGAVSFRT